MKRSTLSSPASWASPTPRSRDRRTSSSTSVRNAVMPITTLKPLRPLSSIRSARSRTLSSSRHALWVPWNHRFRPRLFSPCWAWVFVEATFRLTSTRRFSSSPRVFPMLSLVSSPTREIHRIGLHSCQSEVHLRRGDRRRRCHLLWHPLSHLHALHAPRVPADVSSRISLCSPPIHGV